MSTRKINVVLLSAVLLSASLTPLFSDDSFDDTFADYQISQEEIEKSLEEFTGNNEVRSHDHSLVKEYPQMFCRKNMCVLDSVGDPDGTHVFFLNQGSSAITEYTIAKDAQRDQTGFEHLKSRGLWKIKKPSTVTADGFEEIPGIKVTRFTKRIFNHGLKIDVKYKGYRTKKIGMLLEKILGLGKTFKGNLLVDEYKLFPLWCVTLKDKVELDEFLDYIADQNSKRSGIPHFDQKPILLLTLFDDPTLETLTEIELNSVKSVFNLVNYSDTKTTKFMTDTQMEIAKLSLDVESSNPHYLGEGVKKHVMRKFEGYFKDFDTYDFLALAIVGIGAYVFANNVLTPLKSWLPNFVPTKSKDGTLDPNWIFSSKFWTCGK